MTRLPGALLCVALCSSCAIGQSPALHDRAVRGIEGLAETPQRIERYIDTFVQARKFSGYVFVANDERVLFSRAFGKADYRADLPFTEQTPYNIASITKMLTAYAILTCQAEGLLRVDETLDRYLPDYPHAREVTISQLLSHSSGVRDYAFTPRYLLSKKRDLDFDDIYAIIRGRRLAFPPGERFLYSNSGYQILGNVIEQVSGMSLEEYLRRHVFEPFGMVDSGIEHYGAQSRLAPAVGYTSLGANPRPATGELLSNSGAAGSVLSTVSDLYVWSRSLGALARVPGSVVAEMLTPRVQAFGDVWYGYGCFLGKRVYGGQEHTVVSHSGGFVGYHSMLSRDMESGLTIIILDNFGTLLTQYQEERMEAEIAEIVAKGEP